MLQDICQPISHQFEKDCDRLLGMGFSYSRAIRVTRRQYGDMNKKLQGIKLDVILV